MLRDAEDGFALDPEWGGGEGALLEEATGLCDMGHSGGLMGLEVLEKRLPLDRLPSQTPLPAGAVKEVAWERGVAQTPTHHPRGWCSLNTTPIAQTPVMHLRVVQDVQCSVYISMAGALVVHLTRVNNEKRKHAERQRQQQERQQALLFQQQLQLQFQLQQQQQAQYMYAGWPGMPGGYPMNGQQMVQPGSGVYVPLQDCRSMITVGGNLLHNLPLPGARQ